MQNDTFPVFPNLTSAITDSGLTRKELAQALGISVSSLGRRLRGSIEFRLREMLILHAVFPEIPVSVLLQRRSGYDRQRRNDSCTVNTAGARRQI